MLSRLTVRLGAIVTAAVLAVSLGLAGLVTSPAHAVSGYERGPDPTPSSVLGSGPYAVQTTGVSRLTSVGFGGGTIYYPSSTSEGTYGGVVLAPGFTALSSMYAPLARRIASHGFVVFAIDTTTTLDQPDSRGRQILAAVDHLTSSRAPSAVSQRLDESRIAVSGHSMGGGGTLYAASQRPNLKAAVALQPWHTDKTWGGITVPTMIIGAQLDAIAPVASHSKPFYASMTGAREKAYGEIAGADHLIANTDPDWQGRLMVTWLKRYVDEDTRYSQFLCPAPSSTAVSEYQHTCPD